MTTIHASPASLSDTSLHPRQRITYCGLRAVTRTVGRDEVDIYTVKFADETVELFAHVTGEYDGINCTACLLLMLQEKAEQNG